MQTLWTPVVLGIVGASGCREQADPAVPAAPPAEIGPMDGAPERLAISPDGRHRVHIRRGGSLEIDDVPVVDGAISELAFSPDGAAVVLPVQGADGTDLVRVTLETGGREVLIAWSGPEDRPLYSPDGARLAFVGAPDGLPAVWVLDLATGSTTRLTNDGVAARRVPGQAPAGFVPPPDGSRFEWTATGLAWSADGAAHAVMVPP